MNTSMALHYYRAGSGGGGGGGRRRRGGGGGCTGGPLPPWRLPDIAIGRFVFRDEEGTHQAVDGGVFRRWP